jgi:tetratricopeptide (TPR) repeat protein
MNVIRCSRSMMRSSAIGALFAAILVASFATLASAQAATAASLEGIVHNSAGDPVVGATVHLQSKSESKTLTAQNLTAQTDDKGAYHFSALHEGAYALRVEMKGFADTLSDTFALKANETKTVDLRLGAAAKSVAVPDFFDEPHFSVAGVADTTNFGGHGSDVVVRTREALSKDTSSLGGDAKPASAAEIASLENEKLRVQSLLVKSDSAELHHSLADVDEKLGNSVEAVKEYQRAAELSPLESNIFDWGSELLLHHAPEPAQEVFEKGSRLYPQSVRMLLGWGAAAYARGSTGEAFSRTVRASDLQPENPTPYLFLGRMLKAEVRPSPDVMPVLARFVKLHPDNAMANYYYALGLWKSMNNPEDGEGRAQVESLLKTAIHLDPKFSDAYLQLGILYSAQKELAKAISAYEQAIGTDPASEAAHYRLAQAYRQNGEPDKEKAELIIYHRLVKESAEKNERERHQIQQFVYTLRDPTTPLK